MRIQGSVGGVDSGMVDQIMQAERQPVEQAKERRGRTVQQKNEYTSFNGLLSELGTAADSIKMPSGFKAMTLESSHPDILEGMVDGAADVGSYEFEVKGLAQADKHLDVGFPDRDKTAVGFGYMQIEGEGGKAHDIVIDPGSTLNDVVSKINSAGAGVKAQVINTGNADDPFRLMVASEKTGEAAKINIDADTTYLDFKNIKAGKDLDMNFEDVNIKRDVNKVGDLIDGVKLSAKRAEPGTKVTVNISHDLDKTTANIKMFTDKYNQVSKYMNQQFQYDPSQKKVAGSLAGDGNMRSMMRSLQSQLSDPSAMAGTKYHSLAEVGITTNAKSGELVVDDNKLKAALANDYEGVSKLFTVSEGGEGVASRISNTLKTFRDPQSGAVNNRLKTLDQQIKTQDQDIERQSTRLEERQATLEHQFQTMQTKVSALNGQGEFMAQRFGGGDAQASAPAQKA